MYVQNWSEKKNNKIWTAASKKVKAIIVKIDISKNAWRAPKNICYKKIDPDFPPLSG